MLTILEDNEIDIACFCETWFDSATGIFTSTIKDAGYEIIHGHRDDKGGGGVAIIYKRQLKIKKGRASSSKFKSFEFSYITLSLSTDWKVLITCIYRRQEVSCVTFCEEFESFMDELSDQPSEVVVMGDFNVWIEEEDDSDSKKLLTLMNAQGLSQLIDKPTHQDGHTLDHLYINKEQIKLDYNVYPDRFNFSTDHYPCIIKFPKIGHNSSKETITYRNLKQMDMSEFMEELKEVVNDLDFDDKDFATCYGEYKSAAELLVNEKAPLVTKTITKQNQPKWVDHEYKKSRIMRRKLEKAWRKNKTSENRVKYVEQRKICAELSISKQQEYYAKLVDGSSSNQRSLFKVVEQLQDKKSTRILPQHTDPKKLANEFNEYYVEKIDKLRKTIPESSMDRTVMNKFEGEKLAVFAPTTDEELREIISEFGVKTSVEDPLPTKVLKFIIDEMIPTYKILVNKSLAEGSVEGIKHSMIDPLLKKDNLDPEIKKHFRPVNNLIFISKLIERIVTRRLDGHMAKNNLHNKKQFAYKKHHSTETMMVGIADDVLAGFDEDKCTVMVFLDLSAAFDTIDIEVLLTILSEEIGLTGAALQWCKSFLTDRTQRVNINGQYSESMAVKNGAPQGSVLGPKFYNIYVRGQPKVIQNCGFMSTSFADDSNGMKKFAITFQYNVLKHDVPMCISEVTKWMNSMFLKINPDKTEIILFHPDWLKSQVVVKGTNIGDECIRFSDEVKNVGVWLDQNLNLDKHINKIVSHCYKLLKDLGRIRNVLSQKHAEMLVHAIITSRLDYCNSLYFNISKSNLYKLQKVQNAAARLVMRSKRRCSVSGALKELHWLRIEARVMFKIILLIYKSVTGQCSANLEIRYKSHQCRPQDELLLEAVGAKTKYGRRRFQYVGPRLWNALPVEIRREENMDTFKTKVKTLLFNDAEGFKKLAFKYL